MAIDCESGWICDVTDVLIVSVTTYWRKEMNNKFMRKIFCLWCRNTLSGIVSCKILHCQPRQVSIKNTSGRHINIQWWWLVDCWQSRVDNWLSMNVKIALTLGNLWMFENKRDWNWKCGCIHSSQVFSQTTKYI